MLATKALRQAAAHAERTPLIKFIGRRSYPCEFPPSAKAIPEPSPARRPQQAPANHASTHAHGATSPTDPRQMITQETQWLTELVPPAASADHAPQPHPASPTGSLPQGFADAQEAAASGTHSSFSSYRDHAQQFGPLRKTIRSDAAGVGGTPGSILGPVAAPQGSFFDRSELPARFRRTPIELAEMEAVESGGAALLG